MFDVGIYVFDSNSFEPLKEIGDHILKDEALTFGRSLEGRFPDGRFCFGRNIKSLIVGCRSSMHHPLTHSTMV